MVLEIFESNGPRGPQSAQFGSAGESESMSECPPGVNMDHLRKAMVLARDLRLRVVLMGLEPRPVTIALWALIELDMAVALQHISRDEYKVLADYGRRLALKTIRDQSR